MTNKEDFWEKSKSGIRIVEDFANQYFNGEIEVSKEASEIFYDDEEGKMNITDFLVESLNNYIIARDGLRGQEEKQFLDFKKIAEARKELSIWATKSLRWITQLRGMSLISETEIIKTKLEQSEKENCQLKEEKDKLIEENLKLTQLNAELHRVLNRFGSNGNSSTVEG